MPKSIHLLAGSLLLIVAVCPGWSASEVDVLATYGKSTVQIGDIANLALLTRGMDAARERVTVEKRIRELATREMLYRNATAKGVTLDRDQQRAINITQRHRTAVALLQKIFNERKRADGAPALTLGGETPDTKAGNAIEQRRQEIDRIARTVRAAAPVEALPIERMKTSEDSTTLIKVGDYAFDAGEMRLYLDLRPSLGPVFVADATPMEQFITEAALAYEARKLNLHKTPKLRRAGQRALYDATSRIYLARIAQALPEPDDEKIDAELEANRTGDLADWYWGAMQVEFRQIGFFLRAGTETATASPIVEDAASREVSDDEKVHAWLEAVADTERRAKRAYRLIRDGQSAKRVTDAFGEGPEAGRGGRIVSGGWLTKRNIDPQIFKALQGLEIGEVSQPQPAPEGGLMILQLVDRRREPIPGDVRRDRAKDILKERQRNAQESELFEKLLSITQFKLVPNWWEIWTSYTEDGTPENERQ